MDNSLIPGSYLQRLEKLVSLNKKDLNCFHFHLWYSQPDSAQRCKPLSHCQVMSSFGVCPAVINRLKQMVSKLCYSACIPRPALGRSSNEKNSQPIYHENKTVKAKFLSSVEIRWTNPCKALKHVKNTQPNSLGKAWCEGQPLVKQPSWLMVSYCSIR